MTNADTVRDIYAAFGRGDVPAILERLAEDVDWEFAYPTDHEIPWLRRQRGHAGAVAFFQAAGDNLEFNSFAVDHIVGDGPVVVALVSQDIKVKSTGKTMREMRRRTSGTSTRAAASSASATPPTPCNTAAPCSHERQPT